MHKKETSIAKRPAVDRGLFYSRDSMGRHETTPVEYVRWAASRLADLGVKFAGTPAQFEQMIRTRTAKCASRQSSG